MKIRFIFLNIILFNLVLSDGITPEDVIKLIEGKHNPLYFYYDFTDNPNIEKYQSSIYNNSKKFNEMYQKYGVHGYYLIFDIQNINMKGYDDKYDNFMAEIINNTRAFPEDVSQMSFIYADIRISKSESIISFVKGKEVPIDPSNFDQNLTVLFNSFKKSYDQDYFDKVGDKFLEWFDDENGKISTNLVTEIIVLFVVILLVIAETIYCFCIRKQNKIPEDAGTEILKND